MEAQDDSKSERPFSSKTEINVIRVSQMGCGGRLLTVRIITIQLDMKRTVLVIITEDSGQKNNGAVHPGVFEQEKHHHT